MPCEEVPTEMQASEIKPMKYCWTACRPAALKPNMIDVFSFRCGFFVSNRLENCVEGKENYFSLIMNRITNLGEEKK